MRTVWLGLFAITSLFAEHKSGEEELQALHDLYTTMSLPSTTSSREIALYCQSLWERANYEIQAASDPAQKERILRNVQETIGQTVFLAEKVPHEVVEMMNVQDAEVLIALRCKEVLEEMAEHCRIYVQKQVNLQNNEKTLRSIQTQKLATVLLTLQGQLNLGMIPLAEKYLLPHPNVQQLLQEMHCGWQPWLERIVLPESLNSAGVELVRAELDLHSKVVLTDTHCKQVALKALLSHPWHEDAGHYFRVETFEEALADYGELIKRGSLLREINGTHDRFFYKNVLSDIDGDLKQTISLHKSGFLENGMALWRIPCIAAACRRMEIDQPHQVIAKIGHDLCLERGGEKTVLVSITLEEMLDRLAQESVQNRQDLDLSEQKQRARFGFSSIQNRLIQAKVGSLLAMAQAIDQRELHSRVHFVYDAQEECFELYTQTH